MSSREKSDAIEKIAEILAKEEVDLAILFGSFIKLDSFRGIDIAIKLEEVLKIPVHMVSMDKISSSFRLNILRKGAIVFEKPGIYEALFMQTIDKLVLQTKG